MVSFSRHARVSLDVEPHCGSLGVAMVEGDQSDLTWFDDRVALRKFALTILELLSKEKAVDPMNIDLSDADIDLIFEGIDAIEKNSKTGMAISSMMAGMLLGKNPEARSAFESEQQARDRAELAAIRAKVEDGALLKAKLIAFRRSRNAKDFYANSQK
jgi:hypothetical protein